MFRSISSNALLVVTMTVALLSGACQENPDSRAIIARAISAHGGEQYRNCNIHFTFRTFQYQIERRDGRFAYSRTFEDSSGTIVDLLTNDGLTRTIDGQRVVLPPDRRGAYARSVNSVAYFALLPAPLSDPPVRSRYLGEATIDGVEYQKVEVRFTEAGGGRDFEDVFVYWFEKDSGLIGYLAYRFTVDGGGIRFRAAYNSRVIAGIRFSDYRNYTVSGATPGLAALDQLIGTERLKLVSQIKLEHVSVGRMLEDSTGSDK